MTVRADCRRFWGIALISLVSAQAGAGDDQRQPKERFQMPLGSGFLVFHPNGESFAGKVTGRTGRPSDIKVWSRANQEELLHIQAHRDNVWSLCYSADGKRLASNGSLDVKIWDMPSEKEHRSFKLPITARCLVLVPDGTLVITGHNDGRIRFWNVENAKQVGMIRGHTDWITQLALSPDGKQVASSSVDQTAKVWDVERRIEVKSLRGHRWYVSSVAFGPAGRRIVTGSDDHSARIWDLESGTTLAELQGHEDWVRDVDYSPDGRWIATASSDHSARIWDATTGKELVVLKSHTDEVLRVVFSPDSSLLLSAGLDKKVVGWDLTGLVSDR